MKLSQVLKANLDKKRIKITELSKATKIPVQTLHNWLAGQKPRDIEQVKKVADFFGISINKLCFDEIEHTNRDISEFREGLLSGVFEVVIRKQGSSDG